jgi:hypothetical protein
LESLKQAFGNQLLSLEAFTAVQSWYDAAEDSQDRHYSIPFNRLTHLKTLLFQVNREHSLPAEQKHEERISFESYSSVLRAARQLVQANIVKRSDRQMALQVRTFGDVLFMTHNLPLGLPALKKKQ